MRVVVRFVVRIVREGGSGDHRLAGCLGFTLIEAVVAIGLIAGTLSLLAGALMLSATTNRAAWRASLATTFAGSKLESLRRAASVAAYSADESLWQNRDGFCEVLDEHGAVAGNCGPEVEGAPFVRRWSMSAAPVAGTVAIRVTVAWRQAALASSPEEQRDEVRFSTLALLQGP